MPIEFCAIKDNPVISALKLLMASPKAANTSVNLTMISDPAEVVECDYVFIDSASEESAPAIIAGAHGRAILTVSDIDGFAGMGGMIELKRNLNRVKVLISVDALNAHGLRASSKLLSLATIISTSQEPEEL